MKVDSDIDVEEDLSFAGLSRNYILIKPWRNMANRVNKYHKKGYDHYTMTPVIYLLKNC